LDVIERLGHCHLRADHLEADGLRIAFQNPRLAALVVVARDTAARGPQLMPQTNYNHDLVLELQDRRRLAVARMDQLVEDLFGRGDTFRPAPDIGRTTEMRAVGAGRNGNDHNWPRQNRDDFACERYRRIAVLLTYLANCLLDGIGVATAQDCSVIGHSNDEMGGAAFRDRVDKGDHRAPPFARTGPLRFALRKIVLMVSDPLAKFIWRHKSSTRAGSQYSPTGYFWLAGGFGAGSSQTGIRQ
jgi:hypothetical protein